MPTSPGQNYHLHVPDEEDFLKMLNFLYPGQFKVGDRYDCYDFKNQGTGQEIYIEFKRLHRLSDSVDYYMIPLAKYVALEELIEQGDTVYYILKFDECIKSIRLVTGMLEGYQTTSYNNSKNLMVPSHLFDDSISNIIRDSGLQCGSEFIEILEYIHDKNI